MTRAPEHGRGRTPPTHSAGASAGENATGEAGFSVLEAILAMAILAIAMLPILTLQGQFLRSPAVIERAETRMTARQNAVAYLRSVNLDQARTGGLDLGDLAMRWTATPAEAPRQGWLSEDDPARYVITLYRVEVVLVDREDVVFDRFSLKGLGWTAVYPLL